VAPLAHFQRLMLCDDTIFGYEGPEGLELIAASEGVEQGDPAAPSLFCLSLAPALRRVASRLPDAFIGAFMDDVVLIVPPDSAGLALEVASEEFAALGHEVEPGKSQAMSVVGPPPAAPSCWPPAAVLPCRWMPDGLTVAGVPIPREGSQAVASARAADVLLRTRRDCATLLDVCSRGSGGRARCESARQLLLACLQPRLDFCSRVIEPAVLSSTAGRFDMLIHDTFLQIFGIDPDDFPVASNAQLHDSVARGGMGVAELSRRLSHNFVDGALTAAPYVTQVTGSPLREARHELAVATGLERAWYEAAQAVCRSCGTDAPPWAARAAGLGRHDWGARALRSAREAERTSVQRRRCLADVRDAARVASCGGLGSSWTTSSAALGDAAVLPATGALVDGPPLLRADSVLVPDASARVLMRLRLGLLEPGRPCRRRSTDPKAKQFQCPCAETTAQHTLTCSFGPWAIERHNRLARFFQLLVLEIPGCSVKWTQAAPFWPQRGGDPGRPDLRIDVPGWRPLFVDVQVTWPRSAKPGQAARDAENEKALKYQVWCAQRREQPMDFAPLVFEAFGRVGPSTAANIRRLAQRSATDRGLEPKAECRRWFQLLGLRLALDQADILLNS